MSEQPGIGIEETPDRHGAFPRLGDEQLERLRAVGRIREVEPGEVLFREGEGGYDFFVIDSGVIAVVQGYGAENRVVAVHGRHSFLGEPGLRHVAMDERSFALTDRDLTDEDLAAHDDEQPVFLETSQPGIFAVGDVRSGSIKRAASAVGEGSMAVRLVHQRLSAG